MLDAWRSGKIKWYTLDEQEMSQTASDTKSVKITKQTSSRQKKQKKVRVLLSTTGFTSLYHDKVCVSGTKGLQVRKRKPQGNLFRKGTGYLFGERRWKRFKG